MREDMLAEMLNVLKHIANMQLVFGRREMQSMFSTMIETVQKVWSNKRAYYLSEIATIQVKMGFTEQVVEAIERNLVGFNDTIADAFVEAEDKVHFNRLLPLCASELDTAYRMCGKLAQLYPEQAMAIAEVLMNSEEE